MGQNTNNIYKWLMYEKILLGVASISGWLPVIWALFLPDIMIFFDWIINFFSILEKPSFKETVSLGYIIISLIIYCGLFGVLAYIFPRIYILPAWGLNLYSFYLGMQKITFFLIYIDDPEKFYYFESGENRFHFFTTTDVYMTVLDFFFLIILFRPALFYIRFFWRKMNEFYS